MIDFYGSAEKISFMLDKLYDPENQARNAAAGLVLLDIMAKEDGLSKKQVEAEKARLQIELYAQLEKDRQEKNNAA